MKLSFSQIQKYQMCPKSYQYYYKDKLRPEKKSAALILGAALDVALNSLLLERDLDKSFQIFENNFISFKTDNGKIETLFDNPTVVYSVNDFDSALLTKEDLQLLKNEPPYSELELIREKVGFDNMSIEEKISYNKYNYLAAKNKGKLMLQAYYNNILPKFSKVYEVQKQISLSSTDKDIIIGYIDAIVEIPQYGTVLLDNKTSSIFYEPDAVLTSQQLALYTYIISDEYKIDYAAFAVLLKSPKKQVTKVCTTCGFTDTNSNYKKCYNIINNKRCNGQWEKNTSLTINTQFLIDKISFNKQNIVIENLDLITHGIKLNFFPRNFNVCSNYYGGKCDYFDLCHKK
ncbi:MAG: PD-(D/E)XK nuclease family protein [Bacteroidia bacterium]|nr:PD-(D/E)XK nuclease family protein [Bacteroidia bacterium]